MDKQITSKLCVITVDESAEIKLGDLHVNVDKTLDGHEQFNIYVATQVKLNFIAMCKQNNSSIKFYKVKSISGIVHQNETLK